MERIGRVWLNIFQFGNGKDEGLAQGGLTVFERHSGGHRLVGNGEGLTDAVDAFDIDPLNLPIVGAVGVVVVLGDLDRLEQASHATIGKHNILVSVNYGILFGVIIIHGRKEW